MDFLNSKYINIFLLFSASLLLFLAARPSFILAKEYYSNETRIEKLKAKNEADSSLIHRLEKMKFLLSSKAEQNASENGMLAFIDSITVKSGIVLENYSPTFQLNLNASDEEKIPANFKIQLYSITISGEYWRIIDFIANFESNYFGCIIKNCNFSLNKSKNSEMGKLNCKIVIEKIRPKNEN